MFFMTLTSYIDIKINKSDTCVKCVICTYVEIKFKKSTHELLLLVLKDKTIEGQS